MFGKFRAVIGLSRLDRKRSNLLQLLDKVPSRCARESLVGISKGESGFDIYGSNDVSFCSHKKEGDGVYLDKAAGIFGNVFTNPEFLFLRQAGFMESEFTRFAIKSRFDVIIRQFSFFLETFYNIGNCCFADAR